MLGCQPEQLRQGTIVGKHYHAAWTEMETHEVGDITITLPVEHPERWEVVIADEEGRTRRIDVDRETYHEARRGEWWSDGAPAEAEAE
jgi:uncharacterized protein YpmB